MDRRTMTVAGIVGIWVLTFVLKSSWLDLVGPRSGFDIPLYVPLLLSVIWWAINSINVVRQWNRRPVLLFGGNYSGTKGPGVCFIEPLSMTTLPDVPVQDVVEDFVAPKVQTRNNVSLDIDGVITWCVDESRVQDAVVNVRDVRGSVMKRVVAIMSDTVGTKDLDELLHSRQVFADVVLKVLSERLRTWGVVIKSFELKGLKINDPGIEAAIALGAKAEQEGKAELIKAGYQQKVAKALNDASAEYTDSGRWLKQLEMLGEMGRNPSNTMFVPTSVLDALVGALRQGQKSA